MKDNKEITDVITEVTTVITEITRKEEKGISVMSLKFQTGEVCKQLDRTKCNPTNCFVPLWEEAKVEDEVRILYRQNKVQAIYLLKLLEKQEH